MHLSILGKNPACKNHWQQKLTGHKKSLHFFSQNVLNRMENSFHLNIFAPNLLIFFAHSGRFLPASWQKLHRRSVQSHVIDALPGNRVLLVNVSESGLQKSHKSQKVHNCSCSNQYMPSVFGPGFFCSPVDFYKGAFMYGYHIYHLQYSPDKKVQSISTFVLEFNLSIHVRKLNKTRSISKQSIFRSISGAG